MQLVPLRQTLILSFEPISQFPAMLRPHTVLSSLSIGLYREWAEVYHSVILVQHVVYRVCTGALQPTSMKIPSMPTATAVRAIVGINSRKPPLATPPP